MLASMGDGQQVMGGTRRGRKATWKVVVVVVACLVLLGLWGLQTYRTYQPEPGIDETGVATVVSVIGGYYAKWDRSRFDHRVRLDSGSEGIMTFREMFPRARIWVSYRRYPQDDRFEVKLYARLDDP
jgi:hypothetical protein